MIYQFLALLAVHWFADFVLQTHWQASNKSKNNTALLWHVIVYTSAIGLASIAMFGSVGGPYAAVNGLLHLATDWCTSRVTSRLFMKQFSIINISGPGVGDGPHLIGKSNLSLHNFFVVVGLDQLIHHVTLGLTMVYFFGAQ